MNSSKGDDYLLPIRFAIPDSLPSTNELNSGGWTLQLEWHSKLGLPHGVEFELPVFKSTKATESSNQCDAFDKKYLGNKHTVFPMQSQPVTLNELVQIVGGKFEQISPDNWSLSLTRSGQSRVYSLTGCTAIALAFTGAGLAMGSVLGFAFLLMPWVAFYHSSGQHYLRFCGVNIEFRQPVAWSRIERSIPIASIKQVTCIQSQQVIDQRAVLHQVIPETDGNESIVLLANAQSPILARRVCQLIERSIRSRS